MHQMHQQQPQQQAQQQQQIMPMLQGMEQRHGVEKQAVQSAPSKALSGAAAEFVPAWGS
jgi:hypothetical protein